MEVDELIEVVKDITDPAAAPMVANAHRSGCKT